ncbi:MAG: hypothetical protein NTZ09_13620, partial [Candidatus Hydrogenedentes bacterium]|nr:hypothetical protein [Candidatus Hydrogenedentota bacterium]
MARDGQVLPPDPAPGRNTSCRIVLFSIASRNSPAIHVQNAVAQNVEPHEGTLAGLVYAVTSNGGTS